MLNITFFIFVGLYTWASSVVMRNDPLSKKVETQLSSSFKHLKSFFITSRDLFKLLFIDLFLVTFKRVKSSSIDLPSNQSDSSQNAVNVRESDYPAEILSISTKLKEDFGEINKQDRSKQ